LAVSGGTFYVDVAPRIARDFSKNLTKQMVGPMARTADRSGDDSGRRFGLRFNKRLGAGFSASTRIARTAASGIAGAFAAVQVAGFLKGAIDEAREAQKVGRQTAAVIKATGGAAKVTAADVGRLADSLSRKVGVDDEVIQAGANMLLTFKGVRNEVGRNNDIFNQASATILDMTAAMHQGEVTQQGLEKATIQVGKALNDPIKGITALTRVGVTFTEGQKKQIKSLVESGHKMEAQKIILAELKSEFGGAAKAAADPWQRVVVAFKNVQEAIGLRLLPKINDLFTFLEKNLVPKLGGLKKAWDANKDSILSLLSPFDAVNNKSQTADERAQSLADSLTTLTEGLGKGARFLDRLGDHLNSLQASLDVTAKAIHTKFVRPAVASFLGLVRNWLVGMHTILRAAASTAEALHLPWAKNLRKIERETRSALNDVQHRIDQLHGKTIDIKARTNVQVARSVRLYLAASNVPGFHAKGTLLPGYGGGDILPAMLEPGEAVVPKHAARRPEFRSWAKAQGIPGFQMGGLASRFYNPTVRQTGRIGQSMADVAAYVIKSMLGSPAIKAFIRSVDPLPYIWGAAGPGGYDCSGLVSAVLGKATGKGGGHGQRYFTTSSIHSGILGLKPGLGGILQIGVTAGTGHMAGRYGGLGFEAESTRTGIKVGAAASRPESFARHFHLAKGGRISREMVEQLARMRGLDIGGDEGQLVVNGRALGHGGIVTRPTLTMLGERGREAVVPLQRSDGIRLHPESIKALAAELRKAPPVVAVRDIQTGLLRRQDTKGGMPLGLR
jgi:acid phosphatase family membrane protein YuiD